MTRIALRGRTLSFKGDPATTGDAAVETHEDGIVLIEGGRILAHGHAGAVDSAGAEVRRYPNGLILPGLIDAHVHYPQVQVVASYGAQLLEWLERYTFVAEQKFADPEHAQAQARFFFDALLRHGTTTAAVYATTHAASAEALFAEAEARTMRVIGGKVMMDQNCPEGLRDGPGYGYDESEALIARWHGVGRVAYAVTPRFAITSSEAGLEAAGALIRAHPECYVQTHLSENRAEVRLAGELFPWSANYTDIYDRYGLLGPRSLFGHCIHLDAAEAARLAETESIACFCPTSNLFIGSGLFDMARLRRAGVRVALATDIGGGTSYSMLQTAAEGYKVLQLQGQSWAPLSLFHAMTRGNAEALGLADEIGTLDPGTAADITVLDPHATPAMAHRAAAIENGDLAETLFVLALMGDDRAVQATWVAGRCLHAR